MMSQGITLANFRIPRKDAKSLKICLDYGAHYKVTELSHPLSPKNAINLYLDVFKKMCQPNDFELQLFSDFLSNRFNDIVSMVQCKDEEDIASVEVSKGNPPKI